jgi:hypothetical protein
MWFVIVKGNLYFGGWNIIPERPVFHWVSHKLAADLIFANTDEDVARWDHIADVLGGELVQIPNPTLQPYKPYQER